ncbi:hypothetical protein JTB14_030738 [Gonioctena quinquepunctata]|nr:hypothetical protein JTB14_030738 [Gonioctena quinquepunctata]
MLPPFMSNGISGGSLKQLIHFAQLVMEGDFVHYDWGSEENKRKYGSIAPPLYDLGKISFPVAIFYGESDILVSKEVSE